ncbi:MAG: hypothetical protein EOS75_29360 [Mesorhizobium sp.]|nr:MAG: hypothetical protein EOS75_29360 [Mesorhizobium sp.]
MSAAKNSLLYAFYGLLVTYVREISLIPLTFSEKSRRTERPTVRPPVEDGGAASLRADVPLHRLVHRPAIFEYALVARDRAALKAVGQKRQDRRSLFLNSPSPAALEAAERVFARRLDRLKDEPVTAAAFSPSYPIPHSTNRPALPSDLIQGQKLEDVVQLSAQKNVERSGTDRTAVKSDIVEGQFPIAFARLFNPSAIPVDPSDYDKIVVAPVGRVDQLIDDLMDVEDWEAKLAFVAASLLPQDPSDRFARARRVRAHRIIDRLRLDDGHLKTLRAMADACYISEDQRSEFIILQILVMAGDLGFVAERHVRLDIQAMMSLVAMTPECFQWNEDHIVAVDWNPLNADFVIVDGPLPQAMATSLPVDVLFAPRSLRDVPGLGERASLVATIAGPYSQAEDLLSAETARLSQGIMERYAAIIQDTRLAPLAALIREAAIRVDDVLFSSMIPVWAAHQAILARSPKRFAVITDSIAFAVCLARLAQTIDRNIAIDIRMTKPVEADYDDVDIAPTHPAESAASDTVSWMSDLGLLGEASDTRPISPSSATLFAGRPFDRNYIADLKALMPLALNNGPVHLVNTTSSRAQPGKPTLSVADVLPFSHRITLWEEPERQARLVAGDKIPESLKNHGSNVLSAILEQADGNLRPYIIFSEPQLRRLLERVLPAIIVSAAHVRTAVRIAAPARLICLPGRDWLSRMLAADIRARMPSSVRSFDVQTVFIGPRRRYKPTNCDVQVVIDTHSAQLMSTFFELAPDRILIGGSPRYSASLKAARAETRKPGGYRILFTASPVLDRCLPVIAALCEAMEAHPDAQLVIRVHPSSGAADIVRISTLTSGLGANAEIEKDGSIAASLAAADLVVTRYSNTGLEAAMLGKLVIAADFHQERPPIPLDEMGVAIKAATPDDLRRAIADVRNNGPAAEQFYHTCQEYFQKNPQMLDEDSEISLWKAISLQ